MSQLRVYFILTTCLLFCLQTHAVNVMTGGIKNQAIFGIEFPGDARSFYAREAGVIAISKQEYVTAAFKVLELNIVTDGPALLRIYYSRALRPGELANALGSAARSSGLPATSIVQTPLPPQVKAMAERSAKVTDTATSQTVIKEYPLATHAHTFEFRVSSRNELLALHDALKEHWLKEPAYYEDGQIVDSSGNTERQMKPRRLGGTLFKVEE